MAILVAIEILGVLMVQGTTIDLEIMEVIMVVIETMEGFLVSQVVINLRMVHLVDVHLGILGLIGMAILVRSLISYLSVKFVVNVDILHQTVFT